MSELRQEVESFLSLINDSAAAWQSIELRCVSLFTDGAYHNAITRLTLDYRSPPKSTEIEVLARTRSLFAFRTTVGASALEPILARIASGYLEVGAAKIACLTGVQTEAVKPYGNAYSRSASTANDVLIEPFGRAHLLRIAGDSMQFALRGIAGGREEVDAELRSADIPWDGVDGLVDLMFGAQSSVNYDRQSTIEILAPLEARIETDTSSLIRGKFTASVITANPRLADHCSLGFSAVKDRGAFGGRSSTQIVAADWAADGRVFRAVKTFDAGNDVARGSIFLRVGGRHVIDRVVVRDAAQGEGNHRTIAYSVADPGLSIFRQWLLDAQGSQAPEFESAVGRLFALAGFVVDKFAGDKKLTDAVDSLAYMPGYEGLLAIECTVGGLQSAEGKTGKLVARAAALAEAMQGRPGYEVLPIMVTALPNAKVAPADRENAATNGIIVLTRDDLAALLELVQDRDDTTSTMEFIRSRIPPTDVKSR